MVASTSIVRAGATPDSVVSSLATARGSVSPHRPSCLGGVMYTKYVHRGDVHQVCAQYIWDGQPSVRPDQITEGGHYTRVVRGFPETPRGVIDLVLHEVDQAGERMHDP
jgi:hypothetical protein